MFDRTLFCLGSRIVPQIWFCPRWVRFGSFLVINLALWAGIFALLGIPLAYGCLSVAIFIAFHLLVVASWGATAEAWAILPVENLSSGAKILPHFQSIHD
jgi:hypothetical protein